jgi:hypothetical protein
VAEPVRLLTAPGVRARQHVDMSDHKGHHPTDHDHRDEAAHSARPGDADHRGDPAQGHDGHGHVAVQGVDVAVDPARGHGHGHGDDADHARGHAVQAVRTGSSRARSVRRARWLNLATIGWNALEGVVAVAAGLAAGSVSLVGFGFDSGIEVSAALVVTWRLSQERRDTCTQPSDRLATRAIAVSFALLAGYVGVEASRDLLTGDGPEASTVGVVLAALSLVTMPWLAWAKRRLGPSLGSTAVVADAKQTNLCALLSAVVLVGLAANAALGWWWADPAAGLVIAGLAAVEARRTWHAEALADTCCA